MSARILICWPGDPQSAVLREALRAVAPDISIDELPDYPFGFDLPELDTEQTGIIIVGLRDRERGLDALRLLHAAAPGVPVAAVGEAESAELMLEAMRAGARDYLWAPFEPAKLQALLNSMPQAKGPSGAGRLIAFASAQQNDGGSTLGAHFAHAVRARTSRRVLLLDCDLDCSVVCFRLGIKPAYHLGHALSRLEDLDDLWGRITSEWNGLRILPSPATGEPLFDDLRERLPEVARSAANRFDFVVADLPAALPPQAREVALAAEAVYLVSTAELVSAHLARRRLERLLAVGVHREAVRFVVNRADARNAIPLATLAEAVGVEVYADLPNDYDAVSEAAMRGGLVSGESRLGRGIERFVDKAIGAKEADAEPQGRPGKWRRMLSLR